MTRYEDPARGISFSYPSGWELEELRDMNGILLICPDIEGDWQANIFFEVRTDPEHRSIEASLDDLVSNLRQHKDQFRLSSKSRQTHPKGFDYGSIEYTSNAEGTALVEWEYIVQRKGGDVVFIMASSATSLRAKYEPIFGRVRDSLEIN